MGMFDTFYGHVNCPACGRVHLIEEQTKDYECALQSYYIGDYIDGDNCSYIYEFETVCMGGTLERFNVHIVIVNGQIVGFYSDDDLPSNDINNYDNIQTGIGRLQMYQERCVTKLGQENIYNYDGKYLYNVGERITALGTEWLIDKAYREVDKDATEPLPIMVYEVHDDTGLQRILCLKQSYIKVLGYVYNYRDLSNTQNRGNYDAYTYYSGYGTTLEELN